MTSLEALTATCRRIYTATGGPKVDPATELKTKIRALLRRAQTRKGEIHHLLPELKRDFEQLAQLPNVPAEYLELLRDGIRRLERSNQPPVSATLIELGLVTRVTPLHPDATLEGADELDHQELEINMELEKLGLALDQLKVLALGQKEELQKQEPLIDTLTKQTQGQISTLRTLTQRTQELNTATTRGQLALYAVLTFVLLCVGGAILIVL